MDNMAPYEDQLAILKFNSFAIDLFPVHGTMYHWDIFHIGIQCISLISLCTPEASPFQSLPKLINHFPIP